MPSSADGGEIVAVRAGVSGEKVGRREKEVEERRGEMEAGRKSGSRGALQSRQRRQD